eukprot:356048-Chlamydomonas_euryale.AAC.1
MRVCACRPSKCVRVLVAQANACVCLSPKHMRACACRPSKCVRVLVAQANACVCLSPKQMRACACRPSKCEVCLSPKQMRGVLVAQANACVCCQSKTAPGHASIDPVVVPPILKQPRAMHPSIPWWCRQFQNGPGPSIHPSIYPYHRGAANSKQPQAMHRIDRWKDHTQMM